MFPPLILLLMPFDWTNFAQGAATQGVGSVLGFVNGLINQSYNKANMATQQRYAQQNMQLSNQLNKEFQDFVWKNEIPANVQAMKRAGLNPAGANTSLSGAGNVSNALSSFAPGSSAPQFDLLTGGRGLSDMVKALAEAKKSGVETSQLEKLFGDQLRSLQADVRSKELANTLNSIYGSLERSKNLEALDKQVIKTAFEIDNLIKQGNFTDAQRVLKEQETETEKYRTSQEKTRADKMEEFMQKQIDEAQSRIEANEASAVASRAQAVASRANAALSNAQREEIMKLLPTKDIILDAQHSLLHNQSLLTISQVKYNWALRDKVINETINTYEDARGKKFTNDQRDRMRHYLDMQIEAATKEQTLQSVNPFHYFGNAMPNMVMPIP